MFELIMLLCYINTMKFLLNILSFPFFSRLYGKIVKIKKPRFLVRRIIRLFANKYDISMNNYVGDIDDYISLSDFFIRKLDTKKRRLIKNSDFLLSPSDSLLTDVELTFENKATQIKGIKYNLDELIGKSLDFSKGYYVLTFYLSPHDYHRFHSPIDTIIKSYYHTGNRLYPVNKMGLKNIKSLFVKNERFVFEMDFKGDELYFVSVGATFVGSIKFDFISDYRTLNKWIDIGYKIEQNDELGRFEMGSTIIIVLKKDNVEEIVVNKGSKLKVGDLIVKVKN